MSPTGHPPDSVGAVAWQVDDASLASRLGDHPVKSAVECPDAPGRITRAVAAVIRSRKQGTMSWGHASLRVVSCRYGVVEDVEYEAYRLSGWNLRLFRDEHVGEPFVSGTLLEDQRGALVLFRNAEPVDRGWYAESQSRNHEIYELWLDLPPEELDAVALRMEAWYDRQRDTLRAGEELPERYDPLSTNCTVVLSRGLDRQVSIFPYRWRRELEDEALLAVLHPSHHLVAKWGGRLPESVHAPRPVFRRHRELPADLVVTREGPGPPPVP